MEEIQLSALQGLGAETDEENGDDDEVIFTKYPHSYHSLLDRSKDL